MDTSPQDPSIPASERTPKLLSAAKNPLKSGFVPTGKRSKQGASKTYLTKRSLLKMMLEQDLRVNDLPVGLADRIRRVAPGFLDNIDRKFTMYQIMELVQLQLVFSKSDYVKQDAINAIKDRIEGKPVQKVQMERLDVEPTELVLPGGRKVLI